jgi:hypothetical protein
MIAKMKPLIKRLDDAKMALAKNRDELRQIQDEITELLDDRDEVIMDLERVCDSLSKYV